MNLNWKMRQISIGAALCGKHHMKTWLISSFCFLESLAVIIKVHSHIDIALYIVLLMVSRSIFQMVLHTVLYLALHMVPYIDFLKIYHIKFLSFSEFSDLFFFLQSCSLHTIFHLKQFLIPGS